MLCKNKSYFEVSNHVLMHSSSRFDIFHLTLTSVSKSTKYGINLLLTSYLDEIVNVSSKTIRKFAWPNRNPAEMRFYCQFGVEFAQIFTNNSPYEIFTHQKIKNLKYTAKKFDNISNIETGLAIFFHILNSRHILGMHTN